MDCSDRGGGYIGGYGYCDSHGCGCGYMDGYGDGDDDGDSGNGRRGGYSRANGYGDGYGFGYGFGCGDSTGDGVSCPSYDVIGSVDHYDAIVIAPWRYLMVGCQAHSLKHWREHWRSIAAEHNAVIDDADAERLLRVAEERTRG